MRSLKFALCFLCFFLDVHVRAEETAIAPKQDHILEQPSVVMAAGSLAEKRGEDALHVIRGLVLIQGPGTFTTPFAEMTCDGECGALLDRQPRHVTLKNLKGEWQLKRLGDPQIYGLPVAQQVTVREVGADGQADMDFPQSLPWVQTISQWGKLYPGGAAEFKTEVSDFRAVWNEAVKKSSQEQVQAARREIASHDKILAQEAAAKAAREREDAELRRLFREKNFLGP